MSHSEKDLDRQVTRHRGPLYGMAAVIAFVAVILVWWLGTEVDEAPAPEGAGAPTETAPPEASPAPGTATD